MTNGNGQPETYTPPELARRWRVKPGKVLAFIRAGELAAFNVATNLSGRPRWRIPREEVEAFELRRQSTPKPRRIKRTSRPEPARRYFSG